MGLSLLSLPKTAYHTTNNPIHVFFSYVFLTYAFRQYQISPKISFFTSTSPLALCLPFIYFTLKSLAISQRYISGGCLFLSHMQVPLFWITFCVKICNYLSVYSFQKFDHGCSSNSCFCLYIEELRLTTTPFLRPPLY